MMESRILCRIAKESLITAFEENILNVSPSWIAGGLLDSLDKSPSDFLHSGRDGNELAACEYFRLHRAAIGDFYRHFTKACLEFRASPFMIGDDLYKYNLIAAVKLDGRRVIVRLKASGNTSNSELRRKVVENMNIAAKELLADDAYLLSFSHRTRRPNKMGRVTELQTHDAWKFVTSRKDIGIEEITRRAWFSSDIEIRRDHHRRIMLTHLNSSLALRKAK